MNTKPFDNSFRWFGGGFERYAKRQSRQQQLNYLSQSILLEEAQNPTLIRWTTATIAASLLLLITWAALANVNEIARSFGEIVPKGFTQLVQHLEGGIVKNIYVSERSLVEKDQVLLRLDGAGAEEDLAEMLTKQRALELQNERLHAFVENRQPNFNAYADNPAMVAKQRDIYVSMIKARDSEQEVLQKQLDQKVDSMNMLNSRAASVNRNSALLKEENDMYRKMQEQGLMSKTQLMESSRNLNNSQGEYQSLRSEISQADKAIAEYRQRLLSLDAKYRDQAYQQIEMVETQIDQNKQAIAKLRDKVTRLEVRAPVAGLVKGLHVNTVGGVIQPGQTLLEIVPLDSDLVAEVRIMPQDIGHVVKDQPVRIKVSSYDYARYGMLEGKLDLVSATTFSDDQGQKYYRGRVSLNKTYFGKDPSKNRILPGMMIEGDIITGEKTILSYLLKPIQTTIKNAFIER